MGLHARLFFGSVINLLLGLVCAGYLSGWFMSQAQSITGDQYGWPQITFMSTYPEHIRNGYFMFALATMLIIAMMGGILVLLFGASPGRAICGLRYVDAAGRAASVKSVIKRMILICLITGFILLAGPLLGFLFGPAADIFSLIALALGLLLALWLLVVWPSKTASKVDEISGLRPVMRIKKEEE